MRGQFQELINMKEDWYLDRHTRSENLTKVSNCCGVKRSAWSRWNGKISTARKRSNDSHKINPLSSVWKTSFLLKLKSPLVELATRASYLQFLKYKLH